MSRLEYKKKAEKVKSLPGQDCRYRKYQLYKKKHSVFHQSINLHSTSEAHLKLYHALKSCHAESEDYHGAGVVLGGCTLPSHCIHHYQPPYSYPDFSHRLRINTATCRFTSTSNNQMRKKWFFGSALQTCQLELTVHCWSKGALHSHPVEARRQQQEGNRNIPQGYSSLEQKNQQAQGIFREFFKNFLGEGLKKEDFNNAQMTATLIIVVYHTEGLFFF